MNNHGWACYETSEGPHVVPINDTREHKLSDDCWCSPFMDEHIHVHNSLDDREAFETRKRRVS